MQEYDRYGWKVNAVSCHECGLVYLGRTFTYQGAQTFYAKHYRPLVNAWHDKPHGYDWRDETAAYMGCVHNAVPLALHAGRWFDVGGAQCNPERGTDLLELLSVERTYDLVTCCQTLDHLLDPVAAFHKFAQLVEPGGYLWIDWVDYRITQEIKADHPLNWTWATVRRAIPVRQWTYAQPVKIDDRHYGLLLERV